MARPFTSLASPWKCPACLRPIQSSRALSTTPRRLTELRPESPQYIDIPEAKQDGSGHRRRIKGVLPTPRDIFAKGRPGFVHAKTTRLEASAREPSRVPGRAAEADAERATWKALMAHRRRQNLRRGVRELASRRQMTDIKRTRQEKRQRSQERYLANKPLPQEEMLTRTTVPLSMLQFQRGAALPDPERKERLATMRRNVKTKERERSAARRDALHTLYMHARNFITTESQLDDAIERVFQTDENPVVWGHRGRSIWEKQSPDTLEKLTNAANGIQTPSKPRPDETPDMLMKKRLRRVAEELTGGKI